MNTDKVDIPVDLALMGGQVDQLLAKVLSEFKARLEKELIALAAKSLSGQFPIPKPTVSGREEFEVGGRKFEMTGKSSLKQLPEQVEGEGGELDVAALMQFSASIKEIKDRLNNDMDLNVQRLKKFNESIKHQPLEIKKEKIGEFVKEFGDINNELTNRLEKINRTLDRSKFGELKASLSGLDPESQIREYQKYIDGNGTFIASAKAEIRKQVEIWKKGTIAQRKVKFSELQEQIKTLKPEDQIAAIDEYLKSGSALVQRAKNLKFNIQDKATGGKFKDTRHEAGLLPIGQREVVWQKYIDDGGKFVREAQREIQRDKDALSGKSFKTTKQEASLLPVGRREAIWQQYITDGGAFVKEANQQIQKDQDAVQNLSFKTAKQDASLLPVGRREAVWQRYLSSGGAFVREANQQIQKDQDAVQNLSFKTAKQDAALLPVGRREAVWQRYIASGGAFAREANQQIQKDQDAIQNLSFKTAKQDANLLPVGKRTLVWQQYLASGGAFVREANQQIQKDQDAVQNLSFKTTRHDANLLPVGQRAAVWQAYLASGGAFAREANQQIQRDKDALARQTISTTRTTRQASVQTFQTEKDRISQLPFADQSQAWETYKSSVGALVDRANKEQQKLSKKFVDMSRTAQRTRFTDWSKQLQTMDPTVALAEMDRFLTNTTTVAFRRFGTDVRIIRDRLQRSIQSTASQMQKEKQKQFANMALIGAGAGLGLLGPAGFPLLNIGFAAMSGGPVGAGIAAIATGLGETTRVIEEYRQKTIEVANAIGFIPTAFKIVEARLKGFEAVLGGVVLSAQAVGEERRLELMKRRGVSIAESQSTWTNFIEGMKTQWREFRTVPTMKDWILQGPSIFETIDKQRQESRLRLEKDLDTSYRNMLAQMMKPTVGIESDPYEVWKRMQTAAFDPTKASEMELQQKLIKETKELSDAIKESNKQRKEFEKKPLSGFPFLLTSGL